jgi:hypothetical protein
VNVSAFTPSFIPAIGAARQRATVRKFKAVGADHPSRARTLAEVGVRDNHLFSRLVRAGVVVAADDDRYFLSADGVAQWERRARIGVLIAMTVILVGVLVALIVAGP